MDKYVKLKDLETYAKIAKTMGAFDSSAEHFLRNARFYATDKAVEVIRCKDCARRLEHETLGNVCVKNSPTLIPVKLDGFCSDAFPTKLKI